MHSKSDHPTKKVAIIGAGMMTKPMADYFMDICGYEVIMADIVLDAALKTINNRPLGKAVLWSTDDPESIDNIVSEVDIVVSMVPKPVHIYVAESCMRNNKSMITTSYEIPELIALDKEAQEKGVLILNELGEDPGMDHLGTQMILDGIRNDGGKLISLHSYGCGLPSFEYNRNPLGYKFAWDPVTFFTAAQTTAAYYENGKRIEVPGNKLFEDFKLVEIADLGMFETYPNKDCYKYLKGFEINDDATFYRGLLRFPGYCNKMNKLSTLGLYNSDDILNFKGMTYRELLASICGSTSTDKLEETVAQYLGLIPNADFIHFLKWLGFFEDKEIGVDKGSMLDVLLDKMLKKMSYEPYEKDMIILHIEAIAEFASGEKEKRMATMRVEGIPYGDSAMSRAVALPAAISAKLILEGKIKASGAHTPISLPQLYKPLLQELATFGYSFKMSFKIFDDKIV